MFFHAVEQIKAGRERVRGRDCPRMRAAGRRFKTGQRAGLLARPPWAPFPTTSLTPPAPPPPSTVPRRSCLPQCSPRRWARAARPRTRGGAWRVTPPGLPTAIGGPLRTSPWRWAGGGRERGVLEGALWGWGDQRQGGQASCCSRADRPPPPPPRPPGGLQERERAFLAVQDVGRSIPARIAMRLAVSVGAARRAAPLHAAATPASARSLT